MVAVRLSLALAFVVAALPAGTAAAPDLLVSSRNTDSVKRYDGDTGAYLGDFVPPASGALRTPQEVLWHPDGSLLVTGLANGRIKRYAGSDGTYLGNFSSGYTLVSPTKTRFGPDGALWVSQWGGTQKVVRFDGVTGVSLGEFTATSIVNGMTPEWDASGNVWVASWGNDGTDGNVQRFDAAGNFLGIFIDSTLLDGPVNLWLDGAELRVVDWTRGSIDRFDAATGAWLGTLLSGLQTAEGYTFGPDGLLYVCDWTGNVVNRYQTDGTLQTAAFLSGGGLNHPNSVVFMPEAPVGAPGEATGGTARLDVAPNPFRDRTALAFDLPRAGAVRLSVFDAGGRRVATLLDGERGAGLHREVWDARGVPAGVYFWRLEADGLVRSGRMARLR